MVIDHRFTRMITHITINLNSQEIDVMYGRVFAAGARN